MRFSQFSVQFCLEICSTGNLRLIIRRVEEIKCVVSLIFFFNFDSDGEDVGLR